jgi:hypothetical protein
MLVHYKKMYHHVSKPAALYVGGGEKNKPLTVSFIFNNIKSCCLLCFPSSSMTAVATRPWAI